MVAFCSIILQPRRKNKFNSQIKKIGSSCVQVIKLKFGISIQTSFKDLPQTYHRYPT